MRARRGAFQLTRPARAKAGQTHQVFYVKSAPICLRQPSRLNAILFAFPGHSRTEKFQMCRVCHGGCVVRLFRMKHRGVALLIFALFPRYLTVISRLSHGYLTVISRLSHGYLTVISRLSHGYLTVISRLSQLYLAAILRLSCGYPAAILRLSRLFPYLFRWPKANDHKNSPQLRRGAGRTRLSAPPPAPTATGRYFGFVIFHLPVSSNSSTNAAS